MKIWVITPRVRSVWIRWNNTLKTGVVQNMMATLLQHYKVRWVWFVDGSIRESRRDFSVAVPIGGSVEIAIESHHETIACSARTRSNHSGETQGKYSCSNSQSAPVDRKTSSAALSCDPNYDISTSLGTGQSVHAFSWKSCYTQAQAENYQNCQSPPSAASIDFGYDAYRYIHVFLTM